MSGNTLGLNFAVTTFGESHGEMLGCIIDGCPPSLALSIEDIQHDLDRRKPGSSKYTSQRREPDKVSIVSGIFEGKTTGTPIALLIPNEDERSRDYEAIKDLFRPGHADFTYHHKYGTRDYRGGGRSSARETVSRVAAGAIARKYLQDIFGIKVYGYLSHMGEYSLAFDNYEAINDNPFFCANLEDVPKIAAYIDKLRKEGDSVGAKITIVAESVPIGLGEPVFDKLSADIAHAMMSINAVKAVEIGDGCLVASQRGTTHRDEMDEHGFLSNHAGGIMGGISNGQPIVVTISLKPTSSITTQGKTQNVSGQVVDVVTKGRHDPCVGIRAVPIAEAMLLLVLMDHVMRNRAQMGK